MDITLDSVRTILDTPRLQKQSLILYFAHTGIPNVVETQDSSAFQFFPWEQLQNRPLKAVHAWFGSRSPNSSGAPDVPVTIQGMKAITAVRMLRFIPDTGEAILKRTENGNRVISLSFKARSTILVAEQIGHKKSEHVVNDLVEVSVNLLDRRIEI
jgi:hypothetical protein